MLTYFCSTQQLAAATLKSSRLSDLLYYTTLKLSVRSRHDYSVYRNIESILHMLTKASPETKPTTPARELRISKWSFHDNVNTTKVN